jgi:hypothetical protein
VWCGGHEFRLRLRILFPVRHTACEYRTDVRRVCAPPNPFCRRVSACCSNCAILSARPATSFSSLSNALTPSSTASTRPPLRKLTTGVCRACASRNTMPSPSASPLCAVTPGATKSQLRASCSRISSALAEDGDGRCQGCLLKGGGSLQGGGFQRRIDYHKRGLARPNRAFHHPGWSSD